MNYKDYTVDDFLMDESFKEWVLNPNLRKDMFWSEFLKAYPEKRLSIQQAVEIIRSLHFEEISIRQDYHDVFRNIIKGKRSNTWVSMQESRKSASKQYLSWLKIAASISIIAVMVYFLYISTDQGGIPNPISQTEKSNPKGRKTTFVLPDGTTVALNSESRLVFPEIFDPAKRVVELTGEAFFDVAENKDWPFVVVCGNTETMALGTSFNIRAWPEDDQVDIALVTGLVVVSHKDNATDQVWLNPGEKLIHDIQTNQFIKINFNLLEEIGWKDKVLIFRKASLEEFVKKLERWYGVSFQIEDPPEEEWSIDGEFRDISLEEILNNLKYIYKTEYKIEGKIVTLKF